MLIGLLALAAAATSPQVLLDEKVPSGLDHARMQVVTIAAAKSANATTAGAAGHSHPGATYVYVLSGQVRSRLGSGPELTFAAGQAWSEAPGEAHYIVNASSTEPARLLVIFLVPSSAKSMTEPLAATSR